VFYIFKKKKKKKKKKERTGVMPNTCKNKGLGTKQNDYGDIELFQESTNLLFGFTFHVSFGVRAPSSVA
jgi:hypothetical protein